VLQLGTDRARDIEAVRPGIGFNGAPDRAEDPRHTLPLVEEHRLGKTAQRHIGIRLERRRPRLPIEPHNRRRAPCQGCRLARRARAEHQHRGQLREQLVQQRVHQTPPVSAQANVNHHTHQIIAISRG
jgi:hypothetical protein